jgi:hypothetical protein
MRNKTYAHRVIVTKQQGVVIKMETHTNGAA